MDILGDGWSDYGRLLLNLILVQVGLLLGVDSSVGGHCVIGFATGKEVIAQWLRW
jgi:3-dehydroquinate synthetase